MRLQFEFCVQCRVWLSRTGGGPAKEHVEESSSSDLKSGSCEERISELEFFVLIREEYRNRVWRRNVVNKPLAKRKGIMRLPCLL